MVSSQGKRLVSSFVKFFSLSLFLTQSIYLLAYPPSLASEINSDSDIIDIGEEILSKISIPKIIAEVEVASQIPQPAIDKVQLYNIEKSVRDLTSFHTRHSESEFIDNVAYWLAEKLQSNCGKDVHIQNFTYFPGNTTSEDDDDFNNIHRQKPFFYNLKNITCDKAGSSNNTIIISAHYDSRTEDLNDSRAGAPGADDNASGVSVLLEVARILSKLNLEHSISFVLFSGEEQGKWGSKYYADFVDKADMDLELLINLDMVGFPSEGPSSVLVEYDNGNVVQDNDKYSQKIAKLIKDIASKSNLNATLGILGNADYLPFEALGYTVIGFHDNGVTKNPNYHKSSDTFDSLDYNYIASIANLTIATILQLDKLASSDAGFVPGM